MRWLIAVVLMAGITEARASSIDYNMTGTVQSVYGNFASAKVGDRISWTLQYNPNTPISSVNTTNLSKVYITYWPVISNIVDQSNGNHLISPSVNSLLFTQLILAGRYFYATEQNDTTLQLRSANPLPTLNLTNFQPNLVPFQLGSSFTKNSFFNYTNMPASGAGFTTSIDSVTAAPTPEPGTLLLFVVGGCILGGVRAAGRCRRVAAA
jgi:hypothetical protein